MCLIHISNNVKVYYEAINIEKATEKFIATFTNQCIRHGLEMSHVCVWMIRFLY